MTTALKEIHIENSKKRDASVRFVSLIREKDPKLAYKGKTIKNSRLLISSDETSEDSLINKHKSKLPNSSVIFLKTSFICDRFVTSKGNDLIFGFLANSSSSSFLLADTATFHPSLANFSATAFPIPLLAPVIHIFF